MRSITIKIPFPPTVNHLRYFRYGRLIKNAEYREFINAIVAAFAERRDLLDPSDFYTVSLIAFPADRRKRDLDNLFKATFDALTKAKVWDDDSQVVEIHAIKGPAAVDPFVIVKISAYIYPTDQELIPEHWGEKTREYKWTKNAKSKFCLLDKNGVK